MNIVGTRIYIQDGESTSIHLMYRDNRDKLVDFLATDIITIYIKDRDSHKVILSKTAETLTSDEKDIIVLNFSTGEILPGDYFYDLIVETPVGSSHTLISGAPITVLENPAPKETLEDGEFTPHRVVGVEADNYVYVHNTPLVCKFAYTSTIKKLTTSGSLILFDEITDDIEDDPTVEDGDDSLIEF